MPVLTTDNPAASNTSSYDAEISRGERFAFGKNWQAFLRIIDERRIRQAEESLARMLRVPTLVGKNFLDIGSGSGLFSLAARRLGARVHSFDFDADSVACGVELRRRFFPGDLEWTVEHGSVLDPEYMQRLGTFDVVYSWGVLHHTGRMWAAVDAACERVAPAGKLFIALYNDLGTRTARWRTIKKVYNRLPPGGYFALWRQYNDRGMNRWRDMVDWVGGYPYEVATPEAVFEFCRQRRFSLINLRCGGVGLGCNEFVFERLQP